MKPDDQIDRFKEAARNLGCDEDEARFDEKLGKLVKHKSKPTSKAETEKTPD
ncbi:hypothetical protein [Acidiphilium sp. 20-67-58]|uniref:hypothetical protein n=1 Tax=Acidiphilium sp. 20-67-58 TaxID=1970291 RepID=UPI0025C3BBAB|nr:hypothetical protein [Acidiphilium sp. 20-67-58]